MFDAQAARRAMVDSQIRVNDVTDHALLAAFSHVPRELFVPKGDRAIAYGDMDLPLGDGRFMLKPRDLAKMMQEVDVHPSDLVLVVGAGRGYAAAILSQMAETVVALECAPELAAAASASLEAVGADNVAVIEGDLRAGVPDQGPYDVILVNGAVSAVPGTWVAQLAEGGRLGVFVRDSAAGHADVYLKADGQTGWRTAFDANVPFLPGFEPQKTFVFNAA